MSVERMKRIGNPPRRMYVRQPKPDSLYPSSVMRFKSKEDRDEALEKREAEKAAEAAETKAEETTGRSISEMAGIANLNETTEEPASEEPTEEPTGEELTEGPNPLAMMGPPPGEEPTGEESTDGELTEEPTGEEPVGEEPTDVMAHLKEHLDDMTVAGLKEMAAEKDLDLSGVRLKADIVETMAKQIMMKASPDHELPAINDEDLARWLINQV